jgi:hypothetical protein
MLQGQIHSVHVFSIFQFSGHPPCALSESSNDHALCCMLNHGNTLVQLLHCLALSSCQLGSTLPPATQLLLSKSQQGDLVGHRRQLSNVLERISRTSCEPLYAINTSHVNRKHFFKNVLCIEAFCPQKIRITKRYSSVVYSSSTVAILTTESSL